MQWRKEKGRKNKDGISGRDETDVSAHCGRGRGTGGMGTMVEQQQAICTPEELPARFVSTALAAFRAIIGNSKKE